MMDKKILRNQLQQTWQVTRRLRILVFLVLVVALYGFIGWRINALLGAQPDPAKVTSQSSAASGPSIDQSVVEKIKQLESTSVNVQALFNEARQNPFRE